MAAWDVVGVWGVFGMMWTADGQYWVLFVLLLDHYVRYSVLVRRYVSYYRMHSTSTYRTLLVLMLATYIATYVATYQPSYLVPK